MSLLINPSSDQSIPLLWVKLLHLDLNAIIGIFPQERITPQALGLELQFAVRSEDWLTAATTGELNRSLDYSKVLASIRSAATLTHFRLLESLYYLLAYLFMRTPHPSEERVELASLKIKLIKSNALSPSGKPHPVLEGEVRQEQWSRLASKLTPLKRIEVATLKDLGIERAKGAELSGRSVLDLPEVHLYHVVSDQTGSLSIYDPDVDLIPLSSTFSEVREGQRRIYSWASGFSVLCVQRRHAAHQEHRANLGDGERP